MRRPAIGICQSLEANRDKVDMIRNALDGIGVKYTTHLRCRTWQDRPADMVEFYLGAGDTVDALMRLAPGKTLNWEMLSWPTESLRALMDTLILGDGSIRSDDGRRCLCNKSTAFLDIAQAIALKLGLVARRGRRVLHFSHRATVGIINDNEPKVERVRYSGLVWCPRVATGMWLARRNGKPFITGNSFPEAVCLVPILASTDPLDLVLDPFAGSGTVGVVAKKLGRRCILIELNPKDCETAAWRVREVPTPMEVFLGR
jgi:hypothetical protein